MEQANEQSKEQELIQTIVDNAQYELKTKIASSLRFTGGSNIEKTERTPEAYQMFFDVYQDMVKENLGNEADDDQVIVIIDEAFEIIVNECTNDFFLYRKKTYGMVRFVYLLALIVLLIAFIFHMLGWTVF
ncbi:MAG: hypothetical protein PHP11_00315 [Erysipelotrichaceae bacterium]|nr:hypothetical protein [Erysipelotrichaceae bacterium]MDD4642144.1 hypothetical protein [Erysipelotrichaceae bacterium]